MKLLDKKPLKVYRDNNKDGVYDFSEEISKKVYTESTYIEQLLQKVENQLK
jgi:hypothetical protein